MMPGEHFCRVLRIRNNFPVMTAEAQQEESKATRNTLAARSFHGSSTVSMRKLTGRNPSLQEIMADFGFFIQPS